MPQFEKKHLQKSSAPHERKEPFFQKGNEGENHFFSPASQNSIQPKLTIGQPGDKYEQEADAMANTVVNQNIAAQVQQKEQEVSKLQRQEAPEEEEVQAKPQVQREAMPEEEEVQAKLDVQRQEAPEEEEVQAKLQVQREAMPEEEEVQAKSNNSTARPSLSSRLQSSRGSGQPLPQKTQAEMSSAFGYDFSGVNVHKDKDSVQMNQELNAQAFTHGKDIYFNEGKYDTESSSGKHLLAHELTHVVQQDKD